MPLPPTNKPSIWFNIKIFLVLCLVKKNIISCILRSCVKAVITRQIVMALSQKDNRILSTKQHNAAN